MNSNKGGPVTFDEAMGRAIKARAATAGLYLVEVAEKAGMAANTLHRFCQIGGNTKTIVKIAEALGIHVSALMKDAEDIMENEGGEK